MRWKRIQKIIFLGIICQILFSLIVSDQLAYSSKDSSWKTFELQSCDSYYISLFDGLSKVTLDENQNFVLDIITDNLTGISFSIHYFEIKELGNSIVQYSRRIEITDTGFQSFNFISARFFLAIETLGNSSQVHTIELNGQYRINGGPWQSFFLKNCYPNSITMFDGGVNKYNLTIYLDIEKIEGSLILETKTYTESGGYSDEFVIIEGLNEFNLILQDAYIEISRPGHVIGQYRIDIHSDLGRVIKLREYFLPSLIFGTLIELIIIFFLIGFFKYRKTTRNWRIFTYMFSGILIAVLTTLIYWFLRFIPIPV